MERFLAVLFQRGVRSFVVRMGTGRIGLGRVFFFFFGKGRYRCPFPGRPLVGPSCRTEPMFVGADFKCTYFLGAGWRCRTLYCHTCSSRHTYLPNESTRGARLYRREKKIRCVLSRFFASLRRRCVSPRWGVVGLGAVMLMDHSYLSNLVPELGSCSLNACHKCFSQLQQYKLVPSLTRKYVEKEKKH